MTAESLAAQCHFSIAVSSSKDYCIGSTLRVSSSHPAESIVWYCNGQRVNTIKAQEMLDTLGRPVATGLPGFLQGIYVDEKGDLYAIGDNVVRKWGSGANGTTVAGGNGEGDAPNQLNGPESVYADESGNVYIGETSGFISKWAPGARTGTNFLTLPNPVVIPGSIFFDCNGNIDVSDGAARVILEYTPGQTNPNTIATLKPLPTGYSAVPVPIGKDAKGNLIVLDNFDNQISVWAPGASTGTTYSGGNAANPAGNSFTFYDSEDMFVDGDDTIYVPDAIGRTIYKWAPGMSKAVSVLGLGSFSYGQYTNEPISICRDQYGNIFVGDQGNARVLKFTMNSSIDTAFTPTTPGAYYAVITDMRGFPMTTDTIYINNPQSGPPAIDITATATATPVCTPITFTATTANAGPDATLQWEVSGVKVGDGSASYSNNLFANNDQVWCILTAAAGCTGAKATDTSNIITLNIDPQGSANVAITAGKTAICQGTPIVFDATVTNGSAQPVFQWLLNGNPVSGDDTAAYHTDSLRNGDIVTCIITSDDVCGLAKSNSIPIEVSTPPTIAPNQTFSMRYGQSLTLDPVVTGNIISWLWTPGATLSDSTIEDPVASPRTTTDYKLTITSAGCGADSGNIIVYVYTPLSIPNAFTPNGDGHNDIFYVLGGPTGSQVEDLAVYDRWGQIVFQDHDAAPGDPTRGWNGYRHGHPAPPDTYVYQIVMRFADGSHQIYKGTVILIR